MIGPPPLPPPRGVRLAVGLLFLAFLAVALPPFLRMPLFIDTVYYQIAAQTIIRGGAPERDLLYFFPPGMPWLLALAGRDEVVRVLDLLIAAASAGLLAAWGRERLPPGRAIWTWMALVALYLSTPESCHAQPDVWMLLPALAALHLRRRQLLGQSGSSLGVGLCLGAACLFKPHVLLPGGLMWLVSAAWVARSSLRRAVLDAAGMLAGGSAAAGAWATWLLLNGAWAPFRENVRDWSAGYYGHVPPLAMRFGHLLVDFQPWSTLHLVLIPLAISAVVRVARSRWDAPETRAAVLYAAFYLGWIDSAAIFQRVYLYHALPALLVALAWAMHWAWRLPGGWPYALGGGFIAAILAVCPLVQPEIVALWPRCWSEGGRARLRDDLTFAPFYPAPIARRTMLERDPKYRARLSVVEWQDLARVADFLRAQQLSDGELTCYNGTTTHLYLDLNLRPSTRFIWPDGTVSFYPDREPLIRAELAGSGQRFIVSDLRRATLTEAGSSQPSGGNLSPPDNFPPAWRDRFPWTEPIVFRAGRYAVHRARGPVARLTGDCYRE